MTRSSWMRRRQHWSAKDAASEKWWWSPNGFLWEYGGFHSHGGTPKWKIPSRNEWLEGSPISGNLLMACIPWKWMKTAVSRGTFWAQWWWIYRWIWKFVGIFRHTQIIDRNGLQWVSQFHGKGVHVGFPAKATISLVQRSSSIHSSRAKYQSKSGSLHVFAYIQFVDICG